MSTIAKLSTAGKIWNLLTSAERRSALVLLGLMLLGMMMETLGVSLVIPAIALLTQSDVARNYPVLKPVFQFLGYPSQQTLVIGGMLVLVGVYLIKTLCLALLAWQQTHFAYGVQAQVSQRLFAIYLHQPYSFHLRRNSAQLIRNVINEVGLFVATGILPGMMLLTESLVLCGLGSLLLIVEPIGTLIVVVVFGAVAFGFHRLTRLRIARWGIARQYDEGMRIQHLQQGLGGVKEVKLLGRESDFLKQYSVHNTHAAFVSRLQSTMQQLPRLGVELLAVMGLAILVISMLSQGRALESVLPALGLFAATAFRLMPSVSRVVAAMQSLRYGLPVIDMLHEELNLSSSDTVASYEVPIPFRTSLELNKVTYTYPDAPGPALKNISLVIHRGESVGLVGSSGAGKSTLADILLGLLPPDKGEVLLDGDDIQHALRNWQNQIGYVPQSIFLTDDSLIHNVAFGLPNEEIDEKAVWHAICAAQLEQFVLDLPEGLNTFVGERGIRLSGGQRQRIGIARALYHDPAVLVLDEATSSLDTATEHEVMQAVQALHGTKTIIIIAHRLSTVEYCDRVYRLDWGKIVGIDTVATSRVGSK